MEYYYNDYNDGLCGDGKEGQDIPVSQQEEQRRQDFPAENAKYWK